MQPQNLFLFILGFSFLAFIQYLGCSLYLSISKKITEPVSTSGQIKIGVAWITLSSLICIIALLAMKLIDYSEVGLIRVVGIIPVVLGFAISILRNKAEWKAFHSKYQKKN
jgi:hypothetical protein